MTAVCLGVKQHAVLFAAIILWEGCPGVEVHAVGGGADGWRSQGQMLACQGCLGG